MEQTSCLRKVDVNEPEQFLSTIPFCDWMEIIFGVRPREDLFVPHIIVINQKVALMKQLFNLFFRICLPMPSDPVKQILNIYRYYLYDVYYKSPEYFLNSSYYQLKYNVLFDVLDICSESTNDPFLWRYTVSNSFEDNNPTTYFEAMASPECVPICQLGCRYLEKTRDCRKEKDSSRKCSLQTCDNLENRTPRKCILQSQKNKQECVYRDTNNWGECFAVACQPEVCEVSEGICKLRSDVNCKKTQVECSNNECMFTNGNCVNKKTQEKCSNDVICIHKNTKEGVKHCIPDFLSKKCNLADNYCNIVDCDGNGEGYECILSNEKCVKKDVHPVKPKPTNHLLFRRNTQEYIEPRSVHNYNDYPVTAVILYSEGTGKVSFRLQL